MIEKDQKTDND